MPLYEYTCRKCRHTFETLASSRTATAAACPKCQSEELDQLIGLPAPGRAAPRPQPPARRLLRGTALHFGRPATRYVILPPESPRGCSAAVCPLFHRGCFVRLSAGKTVALLNGKEVGRVGAGLTFTDMGTRLLFSLAVAGPEMRELAAAVKRLTGTRSFTAASWSCHHVVDLAFTADRLVIRAITPDLQVIDEAVVEAVT